MTIQGLLFAALGFGCDKSGAIGLVPVVSLLGTFISESMWLAVLLSAPQIGASGTPAPLLTRQRLDQAVAVDRATVRPQKTEALSSLEGVDVHRYPSSHLE
jgi:hypothetical protein